MVNKSVVFGFYKCGFAQVVSVDYNQIIKVGLRPVLLTLVAKNVISSKKVNGFDIYYFIQNKLYQLVSSYLSVVS